jgi:hypothetical protein
MYSNSKYWPFIVIAIFIIVIYSFVQKSLEPGCLLYNNRMKGYDFIGIVKSIEENTFNSSSERITTTKGREFYWEEKILKDQKILTIVEKGDSIIKIKNQTYLYIIKKDTTYTIDLITHCDKIQR